MPYPDNFSTAAFYRAHGDAAYDAAVDRAEAATQRDVLRALLLHHSLCWLLKNIDEDFETIFPVPGYGMEDLRDMAEAIRDGTTRAACEARIRAAAMDLARDGRI